MRLAAQPASRPPRLQRYRLLEHIARGRAADVFRAVDPGGEVVALKRLRPLELPFLSDLLAAEACVLSALRHPNLVRARDVSQAREYFTMDYVDGVDLEQLLRLLRARGEAMPIATGVAIAAGVAAGLHVAHTLELAPGVSGGVVHRDLAPSNVLLGFDGAVKLADFGAACVDRHARQYYRLLCGRAGYMAPEQLVGRDVDRRADVFGLGVLRWEMTTGQRLFPGVNAAERAHNTLVGHIPRPSQLRPGYPAALERVVMRALAREPSARYRTCGDLLAGLRAIDGAAPARARSLVGNALRELWRPTGPLRSSPARAAPPG